MLKRAREPYPSDLTDAEWQVLSPLIPGPAKLGRPPRYEKRAILDAIFYVVRSGLFVAHAARRDATLEDCLLLLHALAARRAVDQNA
ncbi:MAG: transposase [Rhodospirillales bacterium]|nr:transposase [Acetobacter sp.]